MKKELEILLATTDYNGIVFGTFRINNDNRFTMSFTEVLPSAINLEDGSVRDRIENYIESLDDETLLYFLRTYDCSISELPETLQVRLPYSEIIEMFYDTSGYTEFIDIDNNTLVFDYSSGGQFDCRPYLKDLFVSNNLFNTLMEAWDNYHLQELPEIKLSEIEILLKEIENQDIDAIVENWVLENKNEFI